MCDHGQGHGFGRHGFMPFMRWMCCPPFERSKESKIKGLEAMKARLQDYLEYIDQQIEELKKPEAEEV